MIVFGAHQLRQIRHVGRDPSRLVLREQLGRRAEPSIKRNRMGKKAPKARAPSSRTEGAPIEKQHRLFVKRDAAALIADASLKGLLDGGLARLREIIVHR